MHPILMKVQKYLSDVAAGLAEPVTKELLVDFARANIQNLERTFQKRPDKFRLRMSNLGRPICQLHMENSGVKGEERPYYSKFRDTYGDLTEALAVLVLKASGINVVSEQQRVSLQVLGETIEGTLDLIIEDEGSDRVWDIKSASNWAFVHKFKDFNSIIGDDPFGYSSQLFGYAKAIGKRPGGWIVINKETGEWNVTPVPEFYDAAEKAALGTIEKNVKAITENAPFQRAFTDIEETFRRQPTGNRMLGITCSFCPFKNHCWKDLEYRPSIASKAENPKKVFYTYIEKDNLNAGKSSDPE